MPISRETHSFCEVCRRMIYIAITPHSTEIAVCDDCLEEFETYKLQFPKTTLNEFMAIKGSI